jgi:hypothetical protein
MQGQNIFLLASMSSLATGLTKPPLQWVLGALFLVVKWLVHEAYYPRKSGAIPLVPHTSSWLAAQQVRGRTSALIDLSNRFCTTL